MSGEVLSLKIDPDDPRMAGFRRSLRRGAVLQLNGAISREAGGSAAEDARVVCGQWIVRGIRQRHDDKPIEVLLERTHTPLNPKP